MLELEEALARILAALPAATSERVPLGEASGRVLAERVVSPIDLPAFDNSAVDGYAVRAVEVASARAEAPVRLRVAGREAAGEVFSGAVESGACVQVFTGAPLPRGADAVVMQEDTRREETSPAQVAILDAVGPQENVRLRGGDVKQGRVLGEAGRRLSLGRLSLLAAAGVSHVKVGRRPTVALVATGSELKEAGTALKPGEIYESNRLGLAALVAQAGGVAQVLPIVPDTPEATRAALERALSVADVVVTCGGVSVGEMDFVKSAFEQLGGRLDFWKVAIKPGKPFVFGRRLPPSTAPGTAAAGHSSRAPSTGGMAGPLGGDQFLFGLPGNPVSAFVTFVLLVRPALLRWQGTEDVAPPTQDGVLAEALANPDARRHFMRVKVDRTGRVRSAGVQGSHVLSSLAEAEGLVEVRPRTTLAAGTGVKVWRLE